MGFRVSYTKRAKKQIDKLDNRQYALIDKWIKNNLIDCQNPQKVPNSEILKSVPGGWRYRVGKYRILAVIRESEVCIEVFRVGHRKGVYRKQG